jgi:hypothetical protein
MTLSEQPNSLLLASNIQEQRLAMACCKVVACRVPVGGADCAVSWAQKNPDVCQTTRCTMAASRRLGVGVGSQKNTAAAVCRSRRCFVVDQEYSSRTVDVWKGATRTATGLTRARREREVQDAPTAQSQLAHVLVGVRRITSIMSVHRPIL